MARMLKDLDHAYHVALDLTREAMELMRAGHQSGERLAYEEKRSPADIVTAVDRAVEAHVRTRLATVFPDHNLWGEEEGKLDRGSAETWIVDPVDGTNNYARRLPLAAFSLALLQDGQPVIGVVADPYRDEVFAARRGQGARLGKQVLRVSSQTSLAGALVLLEIGGGGERERMMRFFERIHTQRGVTRLLGSAALSLAELAAGRGDAAVEARMHPWDIAAGVLLVTEAGGLVSRWDGAPYDVAEAGPLAAAGPALHAQIVQALA